MSESIVLADLHAHVYPCYDTGKALRCAFDNLNRATPRAGIKILALAERSDCRFFRDLSSGRLPVRGFQVAGIPSDPNALSVKADSGDELFLVAGRQLVTRERLEVVALTTDQAPEDGRPIGPVLESIRASGAMACINWAPGKWLGHRGDVVATLIREGHPGDFVLGDTTLRPTVYREPLLMKEARIRGFVVIAGSDPLPFPGEESLPGRYASRWQGSFDPTRPTESLRTLLRSQPLATGFRDNLFQVARRLWLNQKARNNVLRSPCGGTEK